VAQATYVLGGGVTAGEQASAKSSLDLAATYFHYSLGRDVAAFTVYIEANLDEIAQVFAQTYGGSLDSARQFWSGATASAGQHRIWLFLGSQSWTSAPGFIRTKILAHELFHLLQQQLAGESNLSGNVQAGGPLWLLEGSAEYAGFRAIAANNLFGLESARADWVTWTKQSSNSLQSMETGQGFSAAVYPYKIAPLAVDFLLGSGSPDTLVSYYDAIGRGTPWQTAFASAFGRTIDAFYADFAAYRAGLR
jgi:hypothetical protein